MPIHRYVTDLRLIAATDGSALESRGAAGWAWFIDSDNWDAGGLRHGTAQQAELLAILFLLQATPPHVPLHILSDSTYAISACTRWRFNWRKRDWVPTSNKKVVNLNVMKDLDEELTGRLVTFEWIKGHSGHPMNSQADMMCGHASLAVQRGRGFGPHGPGLTGEVA